MIQNAVQQFPGTCIGKVSAVTEDTAFQGIRIRPHLQHIDIMICLQKQYIRVLQAFRGVIRVAAEIGADTGLLSAVKKPVSHRIRRIM